MTHTDPEPAVMWKNITGHISRLSNVTGTHSLSSDLPFDPKEDQLDSYFEILILKCFVHSLDPEQKDQLIEVIEKLLTDKTTVRLLNH